MKTLRPTIRLAYVAELIVGLAAGFAAIRWSEPSETARSLRRGGLNVSTLTTYINPFVNLIGLSALLGLIVEMGRGRQPTAYGLGRWTWAVVGGFVLAHGLREAARYRISNRNPDWSDWLGTALISGSGGGITSTILAIWIALALARPPRDPSPDAREWFGRLFGVAIVLWSVALHVLWYWNW